MIIAKKHKGKKIVLYKNFPLNEKHIIESFSLLKLNDSEVNKLMLAASYWSTTEDGNFYTTYEHKDELDTVFKYIACEHSRQNKNFKDVRAINRQVPEGTSALIRNPLNKTIRIVRRKDSSSKVYFNVLPIDNIKREMFFRDCKLTYYPFVSGKYMINAYYNEKSSELYDIWSNFMDQEFTKLASLEK